MNSLTDRYVAQVVQRLPESSRPDIARELRATLADMVEERLGDRAAPGPEEARAAERAALEELGDPARLALHYQDGPGCLVGPQLFPAFVRLARWLLPLVGVVSAVVNAAVYAATAPEAQLGGMIGAVAGNAVVALLIATGVLTALFAAGERLLPDQDKAALARPADSGQWSADDLDEPARTRRIPRAEPIASLVLLALLAAVPIAPSSFFHVGHLDDGASLVNPQLWRGWLPAYFVLLALLGLLEVWKLAAGRWSAPVLVAGALVDAAFAVLLCAAVLTQQILDPALLEGTGWSPPEWGPAVAVAVIWAVTVWDQVTTVRAYRSGGTPEEVPAR